MQIIHTFSRSICANDLILTSQYIELDSVCLNHGANRAGQCVYNLHNCISVTNKVKINEQNKSIAIEKN